MQEKREEQKSLLPCKKGTCLQGKAVKADEVPGSLVRTRTITLPSLRLRQRERDQDLSKCPQKAEIGKGRGPCSAALSRGKNKQTNKNTTVQWCLKIFFF